MASETNTPAALTSVKTRLEHGLSTPDATPAVEDGRVKADAARRAQQNRMATVTESAAPEGLSTQSKPDLDFDSESSETDDERADPTAAQIEVVNRVLACQKKDYRNILGITSIGSDAREERVFVVNALRKLGSLAHPEFNRAPDASQAFKRIIEAAKKLGADQDEIREVRQWDGEEELAPLRLTTDGRWALATDQMDGVEQISSPEPSVVHKEIYNQATPMLGRLLRDPDSQEIVALIQTLNNQIVEENSKNEVGEGHLQDFTIDVGTFRTIFKNAAPYWKRSVADEEAKAKIDILNEQLRNFNKQHQYPSEWVIQMTGENSNNTTANLRENTVGTAFTNNSKLRYRPCRQKSNHVRYAGEVMKIEGAIKAGSGHHLILSRLGNNGLLVHVLEAASTLGKGFGKAYLQRSDAVLIQPGTAGELDGKKLEDAVFAGVASRRDPKREPMGGWQREAKTLVRVAFGQHATDADFRWFYRSTLGARFGQKAVDEEIDGYRQDAGQARPPAPMKHDQRSKSTEAPAAAVKVEEEEEDDALVTSEPSIDVGMLRRKIKELEEQIRRQEVQHFGPQ